MRKTSESLSALSAGQTVAKRRDLKKSLEELIPSFVALTTALNSFFRIWTLFARSWRRRRRIWRTPISPTLPSLPQCPDELGGLYAAFGQFLSCAPTCAY